MAVPWGPAESSQAHAAAEAGLSVVRELAPEGVIHDSTTLRLGDAFRARSVAPDQFDQLEELEPSANLDEILEPDEVITYPVLEGDEVVSSITVAPDPSGQWRVQAVGALNQMRVVAGIRDEDVAAIGSDPSDYFLLAVPPLRTTLLGRNGPLGVQLSHLYTNERLGHQTRTWGQAGRVLGDAAKAAKQASDEGKDEPCPG